MLLNTDNNLLIVLVLYNEFLENSETFKSLCRESSNFASKKRIIIYDNSPSVRKDLSFLKKYQSFFEIEYVSDETNPGICFAYNYAFSKAYKDNIEWLLLLDQDTKLPKNYLQKFITTINVSNTAIVSYVPRVLQEEKEELISPFKINSFGLMRSLPKKIKGAINYSAIAINSGAFISTSFLSKIGGFSNDYPLDMLDFWLFSKIFKKKKQIYIVDIDVIHDLSVSNFESNVSLNRYESILRAEKLFFSSSRRKKYFHKIRLFKRLVKQVSFKNKSFFNKTLEYIFK